MPAPPPTLALRLSLWTSLALAWCLPALRHLRDDAWDYDEGPLLQAAALARDGAVVELCADRACATVLGSYEVTGSSTNPTVDLPPGVVFWRARGRVGSAAGTIHSPVWSFFVGARSAPVGSSPVG